MRSTRNLKLVLLGGGMLAASACLCGGCFGGGDGEVAPAEEPPLDTDPQWYDEAGKPIPEDWDFDENGNFAPQGEPRDRFGRPLRFDDHGHRVFLPIPVAAAAAYAASRGASGGYYRRGSSWFPFFRSTSGGYRSYPSSGGSSSSGTSGSTYYGGSRPGTTSKPSPAAGGSVSRGGFGGSGASAVS